MSQQTTTAAVQTSKTKRTLPVRLTAEQVAALQPGHRVVARESGKVYSITSREGDVLKGRLNDAQQNMTGPTRPLNPSNLSVYTPETGTAAVEQAKQPEAVQVKNPDGSAPVNPNMVPKQNKVTVTPQATAEDKSAEPKQVYHLEGTERYERIRPTLAQSRNAHRERSKYSGRWIQVNEADVDFEIIEPKEYTPEERAALRQQGLEKDRELMKKREVKDKAEATETEGKAKKAAKADKPKKEKKEQVYAVGMCALIRYGGSKGWDKKVIGAVARKVGYDPSPTTIHIQSKKGKDEADSVPKIEKDLRNELNTFAQEAKAEIKEAGDEKPAKKSGKGKKAAKAGKKAKPAADEDDDAEDEAEAQAAQDAEGEDDEEAETDEEESDDAEDEGDDE
jgi:hypothetical protein